MKQKKISEEISELVNQYENGNVEILPELIEKCTGIRVFALKRWRNYIFHHNIDYDDAKQQTYVILLEALNTYLHDFPKRDKIPFSRYLLTRMKYDLLDYLHDSIEGAVDWHDKKSIEPQHISIDGKLSNCVGENTMLDCIADENSEAQFEMIETEEIKKELILDTHELLENVFADSADRNFLLDYYNSPMFYDIAEGLCEKYGLTVSQALQKNYNMLNILRKSVKIEMLREKYAYDSSVAYHVGVSSFNQNWESSVEKIALNRIESENKIEAMIKGVLQKAI